MNTTGPDYTQSSANPTSDITNVTLQTFPDLVVKHYQTVPLNGKIPCVDDWPNTPFKTVEQVIAHFTQYPHHNAGILSGVQLGDLEGLLVDVDLDAPEAAVFWDIVGPSTPAVFGKTSTPTGHRLYRVPAEMSYAAFKDPTLDDTTAGERSMILEVRCTKRQSMAPGSIHPNGERVSWYGTYGDPPLVDAAELLRAAELVAALVMIARHWPTRGGRNDFALHVAGGLFGIGLGDDIVPVVLETLAEMAGDDEPDKRRATAEATARKRAAGQRVTGLPKLRRALYEVMPKDVANLVMRWLNRSSGGDDRQRLNVASVDIRDTTDQVWDGVVESSEDLDLFSMNGKLVQLERTGEGRLVARAVNFVRMRAIIGDVFRCVKPGRQGDAPAIPPKALAETMVEKVRADVPVLKRIVRAPVVAPDGSIRTRSGYDPITRNYVDLPVGLVIPPVPDTPRDADVADFPFSREFGSGDSDLVKALVIEPFVRTVFEANSPIFVVDATDKGSGKTLLANAAQAIHSGVELAMITPPTNEDEWEKVIATALQHGTTTFAVDNLTQTLQSDALAKATTSSHIVSRKLHTNDTIEGSPNWTWVVTGNNISYSADATRRCLPIRIEPNIARPADRPAEQFNEPDLFRHVIEKRGDYIWAVLTLVQHWFAQGQPPSVKSFGSFQSWVRVVGGILEAAGYARFLDTRDRIYADETSGEGAWSTFMSAWWLEYGSEPVTPGRAMALADDRGIYLDIDATSERGRSTAMGALLRRHNGGVFTAMHQTVKLTRKNRMYHLVALQVGGNDDPGNSDTQSGDSGGSSAPTDATDVTFSTCVTFEQVRCNISGSPVEAKTRKGKSQEVTQVEKVTRTHDQADDDHLTFNPLTPEELADIDPESETPPQGWPRRRYRGHPADESA